MVDELVGRGAHSHVFGLAGDTKRVMKTMRCADVIDLSRVANEVAILRRMSKVRVDGHPVVPQLYGVHLLPGRQAVRATDPETIVRQPPVEVHPQWKIGLVMERYSCNLLEFVEEQAVLIGGARSIAEAKEHASNCQVWYTKAINSVLRAMHELHRLGFLHRDLKLDAVLVRKGPEGPSFVITDFGSASVVHLALSKTPGAALTWAPEHMHASVDGAVKYDDKADVYAFGMLLWQLNHFGAEPRNLAAKHAEGAAAFDAAIASGMRPPVESAFVTLAASKLMARCWVGSASDRPRIRDIVSKGLSSLFDADKLLAYVKAGKREGGAANTSTLMHTAKA